MQQIQLDWEKLARDVADCHIEVADKKLHQLTGREFVDPAEIRAWENRKIELKKFKEICWWDEIERYQVIEMERLGRWADTW